MMVVMRCCSQTLVQYGFGSDTVPVIAGLSNTYCDYITTFEEYQVRRPSFFP